MRSLQYFNEHLDRYVDELRRLTEIESPTGNPAQLELAAELLTEMTGDAAEVDREVIPGWGPLLRMRRPGSGPMVLLLAHLDTVWPLGSWSSPWRVDDGRAYGPGVYDMKGGLMFVPWVLRYLAGEALSHANIEVLVNPNEEAGSPGSRPLIEEAARRADVVLVLEPSSPDGSLKLARKGSGEYAVTIHGRSSHQGVAPEEGVNAVVEAAHQIVRMLDLEDPEAGTTVGPNVISGGTVSNVVPDRAEILVDVRAWTYSELERLERAVRQLEPRCEGSEIEVGGGWNRPPMEASESSIALFDGVQMVGRSLGIELSWVRWGGSSDANLAAAVGAPTIDGFGPVGNGAHQMDEYIEIDRVPERLALLAEVLQSLALLEPAGG